MGIVAITPLDGRYVSKVKILQDYFSEYALIKYRVHVEVEYLIALMNILGLEGDTAGLPQLYQMFTPEQAQKVKDIEKVTNHDVKAVEYFVKEELEKKGLVNLKEWVHFGLTSEDVTNLAYALLLKDFIYASLIPKIDLLLEKIKDLAEQQKAQPMLARTHGQFASPTTLGKEFAVYYHRLRRQKQQLLAFTVLGKLNGATGNFNAHYAAFPQHDWITFSRDFILRLGLTPNPITTQIESHDYMAELFGIVKRMNNIIFDLNIDCWLYISYGYFKQKMKQGEVGSSTMPHKVNPIDFENSEGNIGMANAIFTHMGDKLQRSRLQRDLSCSTVQRNMGVGFGYTFVALASTIKGLGKLEVNKEVIDKDLNEHVEVLAEAIQTVLRREKAPMPYEQLKELTRGKKVTLQDLHAFIDGLTVGDHIKEELKKFAPENYIGKAIELCERALL